MQYDKNLSNWKLKLKLKNGEDKCFYSFINDDKKDKGKGALIRRLINGTFKGKYVSALLIDNQTDTIKHKWVNGILEY